ncbi:MAG: hypothetical protein NZP34_10925 [Caldilineales bacterium]|nr:hypothetical protein [Caldilineales bacterium]
MRIQARMVAHTGPFMPPALLRGSFETFEDAQDVLVVDGALPPETIADTIIVSIPSVCRVPDPALWLS